MTKKLLFVLLLMNAMTASFARSVDSDLYSSYNEFECDVCRSMKKSSFMDCDYIKQSPHITRVDISHLLKGRKSKEALFLVIELEAKHFAEKTESKKIRLLSLKAQSVLAKIKPGDQTRLSIGLVYKRLSKDRLLKISICFDGNYTAGDIISLVNYNSSAVCTPGIFARGIRLLFAHTNLKTGVQFQRNILVGKKGLQVNKGEGDECYDINEKVAEDEGRLEEFLDTMDERFCKTLFEFIKQLKLDNIDVLKVGIENLDFGKVVANEKNKTFSGLEDIGIENLDFSKLDINKIGLEECGLQSGFITKAVEKYFSFDSLFKDGVIL